MDLKAIYKHQSHLVLWHDLQFGTTFRLLPSEVLVGCVFCEDPFSHRVLSRRGKKVFDRLDIAEWVAREVAFGARRMNLYNQDADEFYVNIHLNTEMELPTNRDTVLHFFEQIKKGFPDLRNFHTRENGDLVLEGDKEADSYRWVSIEQRRLCSGHTNPQTLEDAYRQHELVLDMAPPLLTISLLDCEALDVMFGFDFTCEGNHDEFPSCSMLDELPS